MLKGKVESANVTSGEGEITITLEDGKSIEVAEDAIKGPLKSRIWSGIENPETLEGSVIVALVYKSDENDNVYVAKHIAIVPGRTYAHYCGKANNFTAYSDETNGSITIQPTKPLDGVKELAFAIAEQTKFPNGKPEIGDWVTVIAQKPYEKGMTALAVVTCHKALLVPKVIRLEGTVAGVSNSTITLNTDAGTQSITYDDNTIVVIKGATSLNEDQEAIVIALKKDDGELLAKGIFVGLEPSQIIRWLERLRERLGGGESS